MPIFSIIIPTYNQAILLKRCLNSVFQQSFKQYEVIVIDNYSSDNTSKVIKEFTSKIKYRKFRNHGVIAKSRNIGIKLSLGKWICFLDSDDTWSPEKLEQLYLIQKNSSIDLICNAEWVYKNDKKKLWTYGPDSENFYLKMLSKGNLFSTSATSIKKKFLIKHKLLFSEKKNFITCEDYDFFLRIAKVGCIKKFINKPLGSHFFHDDSTSSNLQKHRKAFISVLKHHLTVNEYLKENLTLEKILYRYDFKIKCARLVNYKFKIKNIVKLFKIFLKDPSFSLYLMLEFTLIKIKNLIFYFRFKGL